MIGFGGAPNSLRVPLELLSNEAVRSAVQAGTGVTAIASVAAPSMPSIETSVDGSAGRPTA
ncbi:MAG TPA: hypothetical protein VE111_06890 [Bradyrhizobium sp.]|jgi:DNA-binding transcriptional LysR family regulator|nr:hypothetical protein [Bradyrhizobium sp.]